jgi:hypothetical protein
MHIMSYKYKYTSLAYNLFSFSPYVNRTKVMSKHQNPIIALGKVHQTKLQNLSNLHPNFTTFFDYYVDEI